LNKERKGVFSKIDGKTKDLLLVFALLLALVVSAWQIFQKDEPQETAFTGATEAEIKVMRLLEEIEGVGEANVIVCETEEGVKNVVVVCEGANDLRVVMDVRSAVAAALGTEEKAVKVYAKKE
jgi:hypothetical protein